MQIGGSPPPPITTLRTPYFCIKVLIALAMPPSVGSQPGGDGRCVYLATILRIGDTSSAVIATTELAFTKRSSIDPESGVSREASRSERVLPPIGQEGLPAPANALGNACVRTRSSTAESSAIEGECNSPMPNPFHSTSFTACD